MLRLWIFVFMIIPTFAYGAFELAKPAMPTLVGCDFDNALCRPNPLMDDNERRLQDIERKQQQIEQQQREVEEELIRQQSNSNQPR